MSLKTRLVAYGCVALLCAGIVLAAIHWNRPVEAPAATSDLFQREESRRLGPENPPSPESFYPFEAVERQPLVSGFEVVAAHDAGERVDDEELVLAVVIDQVARAYPLNIMTGPEREVFNDDLSGEPIAATW